MKIIKTDREEISQMIGDYYNHLTAPMDDMYDEGIIPACDLYRIIEKEEEYGYFAVDEENTILQFYLKSEFKAQSKTIFEELLAERGIKKALCGSNDPLFYEQCKGKAINRVNHDFMFLEDKVITVAMPFEGIQMESPSLEDLDEILTYFEGIGMSGDWLSFYFKLRIETESIKLFRFENKIIGTGEMRPSRSADGFANVGMTVSPDFRRRGLGRSILTTMRTLANENGMKAICSTDNSNTASYNTILKSGFNCYHRIEEISF